MTYTRDHHMLNTWLSRHNWIECSPLGQPKCVFLIVFPRFFFLIYISTVYTYYNRKEENGTVRRKRENISWKFRARTMCWFIGFVNDEKSLMLVSEIFSYFSGRRVRCERGNILKLSIVRFAHGEIFRSPSDFNLCWGSTIVYIELKHYL